MIYYNFKTLKLKDIKYVVNMILKNVVLIQVLINYCQDIMNQMHQNYLLINIVVNNIKINVVILINYF